MTPKVLKSNEVTINLYKNEFYKINKKVYYRSRNNFKIHALIFEKHE